MPIPIFQHDKEWVMYYGNPALDPGLPQGLIRPPALLHSGSVNSVEEGTLDLFESCVLRCVSHCFITILLRGAGDATYTKSWMWSWGVTEWYTIVLWPGKTVQVSKCGHTITFKDFIWLRWKTQLLPVEQKTMVLTSLFHYQRRPHRSLSHCRTQKSPPPN